MRQTPSGLTNSTLVTTSNVRHSPADWVFARPGTALESAHPAQSEPFARKKSRRFILCLEVRDEQLRWGEAPASVERDIPQRANALSIADTLIAVTENRMAVARFVRLHRMDEARVHRLAGIRAASDLHRPGPRPLSPGLVTYWSKRARSLWSTFRWMAYGPRVHYTFGHGLTDRFQRQRSFCRPLPRLPGGPVHV